MELIIVVIALVALAFWQRSNFLSIVAGIVAVGFGVYWSVSTAGFVYIMSGVASVAVGIYMLITSGTDLLNKGR